MGGVVPSDVDNRRRLPQWMLRVSAAKQVRKNDTVEENSMNLEEGLMSHPGKEHLVLAKEMLLENSHCRSKCDPKRRKRNSKQQDTDCEGNGPETLPDKENNEVGRRKVSAATKRRKSNISKFGSSEELEVQPLDVDDVELTVEDLMIIAEEYVRKDKNMDQEQASNGKCESESRLSTRISPTSESEGFADGHNFDRTSPTQNISNSYKSNRSSKSEQAGISASITGDPARDMLDLFLGPLLKKPLQKERKTEFVMDDVAICPKFEIQSQKNMVMEEVATITKKKSSLKDKVAMLLD